MLKGYRLALEEYNPHFFQYLTIKGHADIRIQGKPISPWLFESREQTLKVYLPNGYLSESKQVIKQCESIEFLTQMQQRFEKVNARFKIFIDGINYYQPLIGLVDTWHTFLILNKEVHKQSFTALYSDFYYGFLTQKLENDDDPHWRRASEIIINVRKKRKETLFQSYGPMNKIFEKIAHYYGISPEEAKRMLPEEHYPTPGLEERLKFFAFIPNNEGNKLITSEELEQLTVYADKQELAGFCAQKGKATGEVFIINNENDFQKFKDGNVLICKYTTPDMIMLMKKAAAIITDQGGITSHAAITSREFNIPCIVGTGNATKTFRNGDKVEINAELKTIKKVN